MARLCSLYRPENSSEPRSALSARLLSEGEDSTTEVLASASPGRGSKASFCPREPLRRLAKLDSFAAVGSGWIKRSLTMLLTGIRQHSAPNVTREKRRPRALSVQVKLDDGPRFRLQRRYLH